MHRSIDIGTLRKYYSTYQQFLSFCRGRRPTSALLEDWITSKCVDDSITGTSPAQYLSHLGYFIDLNLLPPLRTPRIMRLAQGARKLAKGTPTELCLDPTTVLEIRRVALSPGAPPVCIVFSCQCAVGLRTGEVRRCRSWLLDLLNHRIIIQPFKFDPRWVALSIPLSDWPLFSAWHHLLETKPGQMESLAAAYPARVRSLLRRHQSYATSYDARRFFATVQHTIHNPPDNIAKFLRHRHERTIRFYIKQLTWSQHHAIKTHRHVFVPYS